MNAVPNWSYAGVGVSQIITALKASDIVPCIISCICVMEDGKCKIIKECVNILHIYLFQTNPQEISTFLLKNIK